MEEDKEPKNKTLNFNLCTVMTCVACTVGYFPLLLPSLALLPAAKTVSTLSVVAKKILFSVVT